VPQHHLQILEELAVRFVLECPGRQSEGPKVSGMAVAEFFRMGGTVTVGTGNGAMGS
jgi:hypothetical protein